MATPFHFVFLFLVGAPLVTSTVHDRSCGNDTNNFWLDVVLVIDNSENMINTNVYETISSIFGPKSQIGTGYKDPRSTRVGIITYNYNATMVANLKAIKSLQQLQTQLTTLKNAGNQVFEDSDQTNLDTGLLDAQYIFNNTYDRVNYQKVVIVFTSGYDYAMTSPDAIARALRSNFVNIITVNTGKDKTVSKQLATLASNKMAYSMSENITAELQNALATINCFCPDGWVPYKHYGVCLYTTRQTKHRANANQVCQSLGVPASLPTEFNQKKREFNYELLNSGNLRVNSYWNGLTNQNGSWYWEQPKGKPLIPVHWSSVNCANTFYFLCEAATCDTDNYCD
ncbi:hypothetical protein CAEBREN_17906 [Caenorhabditis brenneri]|uniref:Uncharacterized protein n=1 Tax=Caenorhabditis brenneri TaxID=135651 RepID=G0N3Z1_CAEBE|nr:hypothetical protein CAEBREN_17906 [Caenorhabditis brenneri]